MFGNCFYFNCLIIGHLASLREKNGVDHIKMARVTTKDKVFEKISESDIKNYSQNASKFSAE